MNNTPDVVNPVFHGTSTPAELMGIAIIYLQSGRKELATVQNLELYE